MYRNSALNAVLHLDKIRGIDTIGRDTVIVDLPPIQGGSVNKETISAQRDMARRLQKELSDWIDSPARTGPRVADLAAAVELIGLQSDLGDLARTIDQILDRNTLSGVIGRSAPRE